MISLAPRRITGSHSVTALPEADVADTVELRVLDGRRRRSLSAVLGLLLLGLVFASLLAVVAFEALRVQNEARLDRINGQIEAEQARGKDLRLQLADAASPDRIARDARTKLGMIPPADLTYLRADPVADAKAAQYDPAEEPPPTTVPPPAAPAPGPGSPPAPTTGGASASPASGVGAGSGAATGKASPSSAASGTAGKAANTAGATGSAGKTGTTAGAGSAARTGATGGTGAKAGAATTGGSSSTKATTSTTRPATRAPVGASR